MRAKGSFTCWQMGGAGAVGSQVMTGMAALERLRRAFPGEVAVWPFESLNRPVALVEVWPSLLAGAVKTATREGDIKDAVQVRVLARSIAEAAADGQLARMLDAVPEAARAEEGWILGVGAEEALTLR
jgi:molybdopterin molybdotransferase